MLQCDNEFRSNEFENMCRESGTKMINSSSYKPNSNGAIERFNGTFKSILHKMMTEEDTNNWPYLVNRALGIYNTTYHRTIKNTPSHNHQNNISTKMKNTSVDPPKFKVGDRVRKVLPNDGGKRFGKTFNVQWSETVYEIVKVYGGDIAAYNLKNTSNNQILKNKFYNHDLLKWATL